MKKNFSKVNFKSVHFLLTAVVCVLLLLYIGIFSYLNMAKYTQHVDSDIAVDAILAREIWIEKDLTPSNWISSTERLVIGVPMLSSLFYGMSGSIVWSMGLACAIVGILMLAAIGFTLRRCNVSWLGTATALLALCALPCNGLRNEDQMVPFVTLLWFLFADYYALHSICLFLSIAFYLHLIEHTASDAKYKWYAILFWGFLLVLCGGLALGGMRCLQVVTLPLFVWEVIRLFNDSKRFSAPLSKRRLLAGGFIFSLLFASVLAKLYPTNVDYPMFFQDARTMLSRITEHVPTAVLECIGIKGDCILMSFDALMQMGLLAVLALTVYGLVYIFRSGNPINRNQKLLIGALSASFLLTVFIEIVTTAEVAHNYFFMVWFVIIAVIAVLVSDMERTSPVFAGIIVTCICVFALCNVKYTYADCITTTDNLQEYEEVITYMKSEDIEYGYAEFWDASRITVMTDGAITMGHSYEMEYLGMYWWTTSTKWYVPNLPEDMKTAYVVKIADKDAFLAQFEDPSVMTLGFENDRFAVFISPKNFVSM